MAGETCWHCGGEGLRYTEAGYNYRCPHCEGSGIDPDPEPPPVTDDDAPAFTRAKVLVQQVDNLLAESERTGSLDTGDVLELLVTARNLLAEIE